MSPAAPDRTGAVARAPAGACHATVDRAALVGAEPGAAPLLDVLEPAFMACLREGTSRLHVEASTDGLRVRLRRDGELCTHRLDPDAVPVAALEEWLAALPMELGGAAAGGACVWRLQEMSLHVAVDVVRADDAASAVLEFVRHEPLAPTLDALVADARETRALRELLHAGPGLLLVVGDDRTALGTLADAVAQAAVAPQRKVVQARSIARHPLPGTVQIDGAFAVGGRAGARLLASLLGQDADTLVIDDCVAPDVAAALALRTQGRASLVRTMRARGIGRALELVLAEGTDARWLACHLRAVVMQTRVRRLCPYCRMSVAPEGIDAVLESVVTSLVRRCESPGCDACHGTGIERTEMLLDVLEVDEGVAGALREAGAAAAASRLQASVRSSRAVHALVGAGLVGVCEGLRFG